MDSSRNVRLGVISTIFAFLAWGVLPVYWKALVGINALELLAHRIIWTVVISLVTVSLARRWSEIRAALRSPRAIVCFVAAAGALGANWFTFIHAVSSGHVVECSLGYYINPLVNILLGFVFLRERFRPWQSVAIVLAALAVLNLTVTFGQFPWIALVLAGTFGFYSLLRKTAGYEALPGLFLETGVLFLPALLYLAVIGPGTWEALQVAAWPTYPLLVGTGLVTALPLVTFAFGARRIRLATVGFIQYLTPTGMFLLGVFLYREEFTKHHLITFGLIWVGLAIYSVDTVRAAKWRSNGRGGSVATTPGHEVPGRV